MKWDTNSQLCNIRGENTLIQTLVLRLRGQIQFHEFYSEIPMSIQQVGFFSVESHSKLCSTSVILELYIWRPQLCCLSRLLCELILHRGFDIVQTFFLQFYNPALRIWGINIYYTDTTWPCMQLKVKTFLVLFFLSFVVCLFGNGGLVMDGQHTWGPLQCWDTCGWRTWCPLLSVISAPLSADIAQTRPSYPLGTCRFNWSSMMSSPAQSCQKTNFEPFSEVSFDR